MSAYEVPNDHIAALVNIGQALNVRGVYLGENLQRLALFDEKDRTYVANELVAQNRTSVGYRYSEPVVPADTFPAFRYVDPKLATMEGVAAAIRYVRCYMYQACEDPGWESTFAHAYCQKLLAELVDKFTCRYAADAWDYTGPKLVAEQVAR